MYIFPEYDQYDGLGLAALVRQKEVTPAELVEAAISRMEQALAKLVQGLQLLGVPVSS